MFPEKLMVTKDVYSNEWDGDKEEVTYSAGTDKIDLVNLNPGGLGTNIVAEYQLVKVSRIEATIKETEIPNVEVPNAADPGVAS